MSGILGALRTDGLPVEPAAIRTLMDSLAFAGPDRQATWCRGHVALGHALLRTTSESEDAHQPFSLDGGVRVVADARLDGRRELITALGDAVGRAFTRASDVELILGAYVRWGDDCVDHLLGDFAFAIWDEAKQRLFCARDHLGVKQLYYAHVGRWLLFSNAAECLRRHPAVSDRLNDLAIADFLLFGFNQDPATTSFHDIRRLPPAHTMTWSGTVADLRRYWTLPIEEPVYYRKDRDYTDQFKELLEQAVFDRLRTDRVGLLMSGGLDSAALAATSRDLLGPQHGGVAGFTLVYDSLIPDSERHYAGLVATCLGIPVHYYPLDEPDGWNPSAAARTPEPTETVTDPAPELRCYSEMAAHSRVALYGEGPDNALLYEWRPHICYLTRKRRWGRLAADVGKHVIAHRRVPLLTTIPAIVRERAKEYDPTFPAWIAPGLVKRLRLDERWHALRANSGSAHPVRPRGYASLLTPQWQSLFEAFQPSYTGVALEVRHPYLDIRLLRFLLRVPALPWCRKKHLLRRALRGVLPDAVRLRPKTSLRGDPNLERARRQGLPQAIPSAPLEAYGDAGSLSSAGLESVAAVDAALRFVALSYWLHRK